jgi:hypothetical protein
VALIATLDCSILGKKNPATMHQAGQPALPLESVTQRRSSDWPTIDQRLGG